MTTVGSSTSIYSYASNYTNKTTTSDTASSLTETSTTRATVYSSGDSEDATTTDSTGFKLSSQLLDLLSGDDDEEEDTSVGALETAETTDTTEDDTTETSVTDEFMSLANMTLAEKIRDQYLDENEMTEEDLDAMATEDRAAVEDEIRSSIMQAMGIDESSMDMPQMQPGEGGGPPPRGGPGGPPPSSVSAEETEV
jgi:hypothetical protein